MTPKQWGKGYASEAAQQLKKNGIENKIANSFISIIHKENSDSIKVVKRIGMEILQEVNYLGMNVFIMGDPA